MSCVRNLFWVWNKLSAQDYVTDCDNNNPPFLMVKISYTFPVVKHIWREQVLGFLTPEQQTLNIHIQIKKAKYTLLAFPRKLYVWETLRLSASDETIANKLQYNCNLWFSSAGIQRGGEVVYKF